MIKGRKLRKGTKNIAKEGRICCKTKGFFVLKAGEENDN